MLQPDRDLTLRFCTARGDGIHRISINSAPLFTHDSMALRLASTGPFAVAFGVMLDGAGGEGHAGVRTLAGSECCDSASRR